MNYNSHDPEERDRRVAADQWANIFIYSVITFSVAFFLLAEGFDLLSKAVAAAGATLGLMLFPGIIAAAVARTNPRWSKVFLIVLVICTIGAVFGKHYVLKQNKSQTQYRR
jgi:hypothetical protein